MTNAINTQKCIVMLSAEPLDNAYLDELSPRLTALQPESRQDLSVAPAWFPKDVADAATVEQLQMRWTPAYSVIFTTIAIAVIGTVAYFTSWEIGVFLAGCGIYTAVSAKSKTR